MRNRIRSAISIRMPLFRIGNATVTDTVRVPVNPIVAIGAMVLEWLWHKPTQAVARRRARLG